MAAFPGSRAAALVGVHRLETVAVFRFLFDAKKEQLPRKLPLAKKQKLSGKHPLADKATTQRQSAISPFS